MTRVASGLVVREASAHELACWDMLVRRFANHRVTHLSAWTAALAASGCGRPLALVAERDGEIVGVQPGLLTTVGPWTLYGSPRTGWQTASMGPAFDPARVDTFTLMDATIAYLESRHGVAQIELMHTGLDGEAMGQLGFVGEPVFTYRSRLYPGDERKTFRAMKDSARRNVQRAERLGLEVRFEDDEQFVDEHYDQVREVFLRGGHSVPFGKSRMLELFRHLRDAGGLIAVSVLLPDSQVRIASGMFFIEGTELLLWSWAHRTHYRWYRPTEFMTWAVMRRAMATGCETFDFMGRGEFKRKFGAEPDESKWRWVRSRPAWLGRARAMAGTAYRLQQALRGQARRTAQHVAETVRHRGTTGRHPPAVVMGDVDLVRALGLGGIRSDVLAPPNAAARYSRFTRTCLPWIDPWEGPEALVEALLAHAAVQPEPPVLFYQEDRSLLLVSRYRDRLRHLFRFVIPDATLVEELVDKERFVALSARLGLPIPPTWCLLALDDLAVESLHLDYPVIVKPVTRRQDRWRPLAGEAKAMLADSPAALRTMWSQLAQAGLRVIVQSLVPGPESCIESYHTYVDASGAVVADFTGRKVRTQPLAFGDSSAVEITDADDVRALGQEIVRKLGLTGVAKLDFKRAPDGRLLLLEVNPRFTLWHHAGARAGVNIPALVYGDLVGWPRRDAPRLRAGVHWCKVWTDHAAARASGVPLHRWLTWAIGCEAKSAFAWDDPFPLIGAGTRRWLAHRRAGGMRVSATAVNGDATHRLAAQPGLADPGAAAALQRPRGRST
ncbi:MAG TPA: GNAT family N-acetyltransferase [Gemmatimonadaceae bacterium]